MGNLEVKDSVLVENAELSEVVQCLVQLEITQETLLKDILNQSVGIGLKPEELTEAIRSMVSSKKVETLKKMNDNDKK